jgi:hypothetical protein
MRAGTIKYMAFAQKIGVVFAVLAAVVGGISWYQADPQTKHHLIDQTGKLFAWITTVGLLPWATFFLISWVGKMRSNAAGAGIIFAYTLIEFVLLAYLFGLSGHGKTSWAFITAGVLLCAVYNLFVCDWIAEKFE